MSLRTPLGRVLGLGSAKEGTDHWWSQRVTAVSNLLLGAWFAFAIAGLPGYNYLDMMRFIANPWNGVLLSLLAASLAYHSHLGIQVVIEDYVHEPALKISSLLLSRFAHVLVAFASIYAILRVGLDS
jgi:succinate dehydrogenase / fumarate reductase membrane anchor subunit